MVEQASFGDELRRRRTEAGLSLAGLAQRVHYSKSHLSKVENAVKAPSGDLARRCDAAVEAGGALVALIPAPAAQGLPSVEPGTGEELVMRLGSEGNNQIGVVGRREVLAAGAVTVVAWMLAPAPAAVEHDSQAAGPFATVLRELRGLGQAVPPSVLAPLIVTNLHALTSLAGHARPAARAELLTLAAHYATYAGWMAQESGDDPAANHWTARAADLAAAAGDADLAAYSLVRRALTMLYRHDGLSTVALAQQAQAGATSARVRGLAAQREAQGHAIAGDDRACRGALDRAAALLDESTRDGTGPVIGTSTVDDPAALATGWCLHDLGRSDQAIGILRGELDRIPLPAKRSRARVGARLALALASVREIEEACATVSPVLDSFGTIDSATIRSDLRRVAHTLNRWSGDPAVRAVQPRLAAALRTNG